MATTKTARYWANDNGAICCEKHAGAYLTYAIEEHPNAKEHHTPLGTYELMTDEEVTDFENFINEEIGGRSICETCRYQ